MAWFITPHGFGHAARAASVMAGIQCIAPRTRFKIFTTVPQWFFDQSLTGPFEYHPLHTDIGLAQETPLREDLDKTIQKLDEFLPFDPSLMESLARQVDGCGLILCDIAPLGIAVAQKAGIPSVLIENFTWDWIYQPYAEQNSRIQPHITYLREWFSQADYHIQTQPICQPSPRADFSAEPISRSPKTEPGQVRSQLGIPEGRKMVLLTMGGIQGRYDFLEGLNALKDIFFVIPGGGASDLPEFQDNIILLSSNSSFFHPDLVNAADAVVAKAGYSTLAEVYHTGIPLAYVSRALFPESKTLAAFIEQRMKGFAINPDEFQKGAWISRIPELVSLPRIRPRTPNGAIQTAEFITSLCNV